MNLTATTIDDLAAKYPEAKHQTISLKDGQTHYQSSPKSQRAIVLVHGVSGPLHVWDLIYEGLVKDGFQVVRYDLYGRGFSDRLQTDYNLDLYIRQLEELTTRLGVSQFSLAGSSMGAIVASEFTNRYPERVQNVVLLGPAGFPIEVPFVAKLRDVPVIGDLLFRFLGKSVIRQQNRKYFVHPEKFAAFLGFFADQLEIDGSAEAMRSTMRHVPVQGYEKGYRKLASQEKPIYVIWGRQDATFPHQNMSVLKRWIPKIQTLTIEDVAHLPQYEKPNITLRAMVSFLSEAKPSPSPDHDLSKATSDEKSQVIEELMAIRQLVNSRITSGDPISSIRELSVADFPSPYPQKKNFRAARFREFAGGRARLPQVDDNGRYVDPWGTPYLLTVRSILPNQFQYDIRSAGTNHFFDDSDFGIRQSFVPHSKLIGRMQETIHPFARP